MSTNYTSNNLPRMKKTRGCQCSFRLLMMGGVVVIYACKTWVLKENIKPKLKVFERKALRRI
jgi:hypothetical protein